MNEDDLSPLSALQHLVFCERQCALIYLEQVWVDNWLTITGKNLHDRVDDGLVESRGDRLVVRGLRLISQSLGVAGIADVVEYHRDPGGVRLEGAEGRWRPFPVEYKRGRPKEHRADEVQLCAQAICLEEMQGVSIPAGAIYYGTPRRRTLVTLDAELRGLTASAAKRLRELMRDRVTPLASYGPWCERCSLVALCLPRSAGRGKSAQAYLQRSLAG